MTGILHEVDQRTQLAGRNRLELLLFRLTTNQRFGINVFKVQEVIQCPALTHIPESNPVVRGVANMRGKTIPILDLSSAIGGPELSSELSRFVVVTEYNRSVQGFIVGSVDRIINMNWEEILPPPKGAGKQSYLTAVTRIGEELVEIIDVEKILKEIMGCKDEIGSSTITQQIMDVSTGQHVLAADDSMVARGQIKKVLEYLNIDFTIVNNGKEALDQLKAWVKEGKDLHTWLSLVLSDVEMPMMDGYSLTTAIRRDPAMQDIYVILHTSLSGVFNNAMVEKVGANLFIPKYDPDELASAIGKRMSEHAKTT